MSAATASPSGHSSPYPTDFGHQPTSPQSHFDLSGPSSPLSYGQMAAGSLSRLKSVFRLPVKSKRERLTPEVYSPTAPAVPASPSAPSAVSVNLSQPSTPYTTRSDYFGNGTFYPHGIDGDSPKIPEISASAPISLFGGDDARTEQREGLDQSGHTPSRTRKSGTTSRTDTTSSSKQYHLSSPLPTTPSIRTTAPDQLDTVSPLQESAESFRQYSTMTSDSGPSQDHSSSSGSRLPSSSSPYAPTTYTASSTATTPLRSPGLGLKGKFFNTSSPSSSPPAAYSSTNTAKASSTSSKSKETSPQTPNKKAAQSPSEPRSAAARFLRRVVSAPNTKALFGPFISTAEPVPPLPEKLPKKGVPKPNMMIDLTTTSSEVSIFNSQPTPGGSNASLPFKSLGLSPHGISPLGTRGARSYSTASGKKAHQSSLGVAPPSPSQESPPKTVFRRTYSSNSIKNKTVSAVRTF